MPPDDVATQLALLTQSNDALHTDFERIFNDHEQRLREIEKAVAQISARQTMLAMIQTTFTTVASAIAAIVGKWT